MAQNMAQKNGVALLTAPLCFDCNNQKGGLSFPSRNYELCIMREICYTKEPCP